MLAANHCARATNDAHRRTRRSWSAPRRRRAHGRRSLLTLVSGCGSQAPCFRPACRRPAPRSCRPDQPSSRTEVPEDVRVCISRRAVPRRLTGATGRPGGGSAAERPRQDHRPRSGCPGRGAQEAVVLGGPQLEAAGRGPVVEAPVGAEVLGPGRPAPTGWPAGRGPAAGRSAGRRSRSGPGSGPAVPARRRWRPGCPSCCHRPSTPVAAGGRRRTGPPWRRPPAGRSGGTGCAWCGQP